jgi:MoaA/NifB/PqqE/SkfB family radical SAM enzyme
MDDLLTGEELETLFERLADLLPTVPYDIKTTEGHHFRRVVLQRTRNPASLGRRAPLGVNDSKGFVFVSHTGEIYPSGFLPLSAGNVRRDELVEVYRHSPLFQQLRDSTLLEGKRGCRAGRGRPRNSRGPRRPAAALRARAWSTSN